MGLRDSIIGGSRGIEGALAPIAKSSPKKPPMSFEFYMPFPYLFL